MFHGFCETFRFSLVRAGGVWYNRFVRTKCGGCACGATGDGVKFQKLELYGFKSFADKVEIPFKDGFTAIIGPNGCGKSNVADAIRWSLGEQSAKALRGKTMQDVIFNGTEHRRKMSYCEVSLYFDNSEKTLFPSLSFDQVVITRKLDASNQSDYYINNSRCRMKDIVGLLHDTGIGKDGYSIIGQGRVDEILSQKPDERRGVFDEAAGISKFRADRTAAMRDLERANMNLQSIDEVIAEIERSLVPLRKQAETAKKYEELREQLKVQEVNLYIYNYENNRRIKDNINAAIVRHKAEIEIKDAEIARCGREYEECVHESGGIDRLQAEYNAELLELKVGAERVAGTANLVRERVTNLQNEIARLRSELRSNEAETVIADELISKDEAKKSEEIALRNSVEKQLSEMQRKLGLLSTALEGQESDLENKNDEYVAAIRQLGELRSSLTSIITEKSIQEERGKNLLELINSKKARLSDESTALEVSESATAAARERIKELTVARNEAVFTRKEAEEAVRGYDDDVVSLNAKLGLAEGNLRLLLSVKEDYEGFQDAVKRLMKDAHRDPVLGGRVMGVLAEVISVPEGYESAIEYALGGALQNVLVESEKDAGVLITYLKQKGYGRVTFRPLSACRPTSLRSEYLPALTEPGSFGLASELVECDNKFYPFIQALLGTTVVVDGMTTAERLYRKYNQGFRIVTLDGEIYARGGEITGGSRRTQNSGLLSQEKQIEQARANVDRIRDNIARLKTQREDAQREIELCDEKVAEYDKEISALRIDSSLSSEKYEQARSAVAELEREIEQNAAEYRDVQAAIAELADKIKTIDDYEAVVKEREEERNILIEMRSKSSEKKSERETLSAEVMDLKVQLAGHASAIDSVETNLYRLRTDKRRLSEERVELEAALASAENSLEEIKKAPEKTQFSEEDRKRIAELEELIAGLGDRKRALSEKLLELDAERTRLTDERSAASEKKVRSEGMLETVDADMRHLQEHILEEYDLTYQSALVYRIEGYEQRGAKTAIDELKKAINRLGPVNLLAVETLAETEERLRVQTVQRDDIKNARDDIITVIRSLTDEMAEKFLAAFTQIQENFQTVFSQLFEGGKGTLRLDTSETEDPLEAGIDIFVQPPGKKLGNITLLSGGERTLSAIALLFAILMLRPVPFCVLDEIDAALDDTNAAVFAGFLKKFSERTQFIVITHRKPTMRHADSIFGVTMEEKGVTKIVSITFDEAQKRIRTED